MQKTPYNILEIGKKLNRIMVFHQCPETSEKKRQKASKVYL